MKRKAGKTVTEARIVEAAVQLFARNGYKGTSTRDISRLARVNEVTLFRYFPHKAELFCAAAESRLSRVRMGRDLQNKLATDASLEVIVPMLTEFLLENFFASPDLVRLIFVAGFEVTGADRMVREYLGPYFDIIHSYFERCAAKGLIRDVEPSVATLSLAGVVSAHQNLYRLFTDRELGWDLEHSIPVYSEFLLGALGYQRLGQRRTAES
ncbi:MAG TPA: TetR/AcrR family transcriptional regulator [Candidatus Bathyarchaeia archaeon]|nr:TetR/AcrR family transcriptional regulator [Candidatus Bathyarchaeia archaeon]